MEVMDGDDDDDGSVKCHPNQPKHWTSANINSQVNLSYQLPKKHSLFELGEPPDGTVFNTFRGACVVKVSDIRRRNSIEAPNGRGHTPGKTKTLREVNGHEMGKLHRFTHAKWEVSINSGRRSEMERP
jgi:hypothetical protein